MNDLDERRPPNEVRALSDLVDLAMERILIPTEGTHRAIARRVFRVVGKAGEEPARIHDAISDLVYGSIRTTTSTVTSIVGILATVAGVGRPLRPLTRSRAGVRIVSAINGFWGDELAHRGSDLSLEMSLHDRHGEPLELGSVDQRGHLPAIETVFGTVTGRLVVSIHGLTETERGWGSGESIGDLLETNAGFTSLRLRYNSGLSIPENGRSLSDLLERLTQAWPCHVEEMVLIGHSMGGLVARSAAHLGHDQGSEWARTLTHLVTLGSPHLGAPLEKGVALLARGLAFFPESRSFSTFLDFRSRGIKDLRHGTVLASPVIESWLEEAAGDLYLPPHVKQHFVAGVFTTDPLHPMGVLFGDLIVREGSATGRGARTVEATNVEVLGGTSHQALRRDPDVARRVVSWITGEQAD